MIWPKISRRLVNNSLMSRRYSAILFVLWTFVMIILFYKVTNNDPLNYTTIGPMTSNREIYIDDSISGQLNQNEHHEHVIKQERIQVGDSNLSNDNEETRNSIVIDNVNNWDLRDNVRNGKVFILLIEDENSLKYKSSLRSQAKDRRRQVRPDLESDLPNNNWDLNLPDHIIVVIEILESHRIGYTIGSTRNGLPSSLLADTRDSLTSKDMQYSVIIMDDFMKYTKLNRWLRDQIDRHCRKNNIGIVTYLTNPPILSTIAKTDENNKINKNTIESDKFPDNFTSAPKSKSWQTTTTATTLATAAAANNDNGDIGPDMVTTSAAIASEGSLVADQFPFSFRPIHQNICKSKVGLSRSCLIDYQLNDKSAILRILKRKADFVLHGPLVRNLNNSPWISISTNHVTYEPLTWATLAQENITNNNNTRSANITHFNNTINNSNNDIIDTKLGHHNNEINHHRSKRNLYNPKQRHKRAAIVVNNGVIMEDNGLNRSNEKVMDLEQAMNSNINEQDVVSDDISINDLANDLEQNQIQNGTNDDGMRQHNNDNQLINDDADDADDSLNSGNNELIDRQTLSLYDRGIFDGIKRVIFGGANHHWLNRILLLDSIEHLSAGRILSPLDRFVQIDIDDVFVGEKGTKMTAIDVDSLLTKQAFIATHYLPNFKFNLGYSGAFYERGLEAEKEGDRRLVESAGNFTWFCHTWSHKKAHLFNDSQSIELELSKNLEFARQHQLPTTLLIGNNNNNNNKQITQPNNSEDSAKIGCSYAIAPHHSGGK